PKHGDCARLGWQIPTAVASPAVMSPTNTRCDATSVHERLIASAVFGPTRQASAFAAFVSSLDQMHQVSAASAYGTCTVKPKIARAARQHEAAAVARTPAIP